MESVVELSSALDDERDLRRLRASLHLPYAAVPGLAPAFRAERLARALEAAREQGGIALALRDGGGALLGLLQLEPLPHETRHFARRCARVAYLDAFGTSEAERATRAAALLASAAARADAAGVDVLWTQLRAIDYALQRALDGAGFRFADALVDWVARAEALALADADAPGIVHGASAELAGACGELAAAEMRFNRFRAEPRFERARVDALYRELGERCARGEIGAHFLCARGARGELLGFATLDWSARRDAGAPHEMAAFRFLVRRSEAPRGTGTALLDAGCRWLRAQGAELLLAQTVLQNAGMFRSALRLGFRVEDSLYDLFRWRAA
ncbi:MAG: hypothetical protein IPN34_04140 [Planctomycetes bacterium]|nr:hypothetical protein [Planctomycetota bacterium]